MLVKQLSSISQQSRMDMHGKEPLFFFFFLGLQPQCMEVIRLGVKLEL